MMLHMSIIFALVYSCQCQGCPDSCTCREFHVDCYGRQLQSIPSDLPLSVKKLELQKNEIQDLDGELLTPLQNLESLFLKNNQIAEIKPQTFANISSLESISLIGNQIKDIARDGFYNLPSLQIIDLSDNQLSDLSEKFYNIPSLQRLNLNSNRLTSLTDDSFRHLKNLTYLTLSNNQISFISRAAFLGLDQLSYLMLSSNPLSSVDNFFQGLESLTYLDISYCKIKQFPVGLPWTLRSMNISNNVLTEVRSNQLSSIRHINLIDFDNNEIRFIEKDTFSKAPYLLEIRVNGNKLSQLPFQIPSTVVKFYANGNQIQRLFTNNFDHNSAMFILSLYNNSISDMEPYTFSRLLNLTSLNLGLNKISTLKSFTFVGLRKLTSLSLEQNPISALKDRAFTSLFRVTTLKMSNITSNMTDMAENIFQDLSSLHSLDIQSSPSATGKVLKSAYMLRSLHGLTHLNLMNNGLKVLPPDVRTSLFSLEQIHLSGNEWECDDNLLVLKRWMEASPKIFADKIMCAGPSHLQGRSVAEVDPKEFTATTASTSTTTAKQAYTVPDINEQNFTEGNTQNDTDNKASAKFENIFQQPSTVDSLAPSSTFTLNPASSLGQSKNYLGETTDANSRELTLTSVIQTTTTSILSNQVTNYLLQSSFQSTRSFESQSMLWTSFTEDATVAIDQTSMHQPAYSTLTWAVSDGSADKIPHSFNSKGDNRLPTFSASAGSRMQVTIIGVAVSLLALVSALLVTVVVFHCRQKRKRLAISEPGAAQTHETSDTAFIIKHMVEEPAVAPEDSKYKRLTPGKKSSSSSLSSSASSRKGQKCNRQQSSASSSSRASFDCVRAAQDDDSEMLMYSWN